MKYYVGVIQCDSLYLEHYGIKGQKWGVRRFQNPDGTRTEAGKKRYRVNGQASAQDKDSKSNPYDHSVSNKNRINYVYLKTPF